MEKLKRENFQSGSEWYVFVVLWIVVRRIGLELASDNEVPFKPAENVLKLFPNQIPRF